MCQWRLVFLIFLIHMFSKLVHTAAAGFLALRDERRGTTSLHLPQTQHHSLAIPALHQCVPGMVVVVLMAFYSFDNGQVSIRIPGNKLHSLSDCPLKGQTSGPFSKLHHGSEVSKGRVLMSHGLGGARILEIPWGSGICAVFLAGVGEFSTMVARHIGFKLPVCLPLVLRL